MEQQHLSRSAHKQDEYRRQSLYAWFMVLLQAMLIIFALFAFVLYPVQVSGGSMKPTLAPGEVLLIDKLSPYLRTPPRGALVIFEKPEIEDQFIKRIIALPGEFVDIDEGRIYIDGRLLDESSYTPSLVPNTDFSPLTVPEGCVFVLGDERENSLDSRDAMIGCIPLSDLGGRVRLRVSPFSRVNIFF